MCRFFILVAIVVVPRFSSAQAPKTADQSSAQSPYPKAIVYTSFFVPVVSTSSQGTAWNFSNSFTLGFATGINVLFNDRSGFSFDISPVITTINGNSKVSNFIFDPGPIFRFKHGFLMITRMAFETSGRFGESTVLTKVFTPQKASSLFVALGIPVRFGNNLPPSIGASVFFGIAFR